MVLIASPAVASAASRSWSGPISLDKTGGQQGLYGVACSSASLCTAVDGIGQVVTFDPAAPETPNLTTVTSSSSGSEVTVACPSASQCTVLEGDYEITFDPSSPGTRTTFKVGTSGAFRYLACPSTSQCTAIDQNNGEVTFNPSTGTVISGPAAPDPTGIDGVACASASLCTVVDYNGNEVSFIPATGAVTSGPTLVDSNKGLYGVACPSAMQCTAVDNSGHQVTFNPSTAAVISGPTAINGTAGLQALDCPSATQCTAIDYSGHAVTFVPSTGAVISGPTAIDANGRLTAVACPTSSQCTAVDVTGQEVTFDPRTGAVTSGPATIDDVSSLSAVACPSASQCTAVDLAGQEVTFNPSTGAKTSGPTVIDPGGFYVNGGLSGVACPSVSLCAAVDNAYSQSGNVVIFDPTTGAVIKTLVAADPYGFTSVACPSTTLCAAVDYLAGEVTFNPSTGDVSGVTVIDPDPYSDTLLGVACPSASQCTTLNGATGTETTFDPNTPGNTHPTVDISGGGSLTAVACPSTTQCTAVLNASTGTQSAQQVTFNPTLASDGVTYGPATIDSTGVPSSVACPSVSDCLAPENGRAVEGDPASSARWTAEAIPGAVSLNAVACSSAAQCVTVDQVGNAFVGITAPLSASPPSLAGQAVLGQTLTEAHGSWSPTPTNYTYQWESCNSAATACVAIPGATSQTYTLTAGDVGARIGVLETAVDTTGASAPASSPLTAVVTGIPVNASLPTIAGNAVQGQKLTEAHGSWFNSPTSYTYQWQRCDSAGNACSAIAGANGQSYTLTGPDVAHTIRAQETATNAAGASAPATSKQTALATAAGAPRVTGLRLTNNPFVVSDAKTPIFARATSAKTPRHGTTFKYTLSEAAQVKIVISQRLTGRRHRKKCVAPTRKHGHASACTRILGRGTLTRTSHPGANSVAFSGRIGSRPLKPGHYQATLTATDGTKRTSRPRTIHFTITTR